MRSRTRRRTAGAIALAGVALMATSCDPINGTGRSSATPPYVKAVADDTFITSLITTGDSKATDDGYEFVGIPDGLGARLDDNGKVVVTVNHELTSDKGIFRLHGEKGAFVSQLTLNPSDDGVEAGQDLIQPGVEYWDYLNHAYDDTAPAAGVRASDGKSFPTYLNAFGRFCSASLTDPGQLYYASSGRGYTGQIRFANEETGDEGRVFGITEDGTTRQLPRLGLASWENTLAAANHSDTTLIQGNEDSSAGQIHVYVGRKVATGSPFSRAGLQNGTSNVVTLDVDGLPDTADPTTDAGFRSAYTKGASVPFKLASINTDQSGAEQNAEGAAKGISLNRIEDGAWDPSNPNDFWFVTTEGGVGTGDGGGGGLWKLSYTNIEQPSLGGTLTLVLDGSEAITTNGDVGVKTGSLNKPDNLDIDANGNLLIQEDPGASDPISRIVAYRIADGALATVAQFDPALFDPTSPTFLTNDEESSGIIDVSEIYGDGNFLFDAQVHTAAQLPPGEGPNTVEELVEGGQLLRLKVTNWDSVYGSSLPG